MSGKRGASKKSPGSLPFPAMWLVGAGVALLLLLGFFLLGGDRRTESEPQPVTLPVPVAEPEPQPVLRTPPRVPDEQPTAEPDAPEPDPLPPLMPPPASLANSDGFVRELAAVLAPKLSQWLVPEEQVRKWVLLVDLMAEGDLPRKYRPLDYPMPTFKVNKTDVALFVDESNYRRADQLIETITAIEPQTLARYYQSWLPLLEEAYREQGKPGSFEQRLILAMKNVVYSEPRPGKGALKQPHVLYQYSDPELEQRSDVDKLLWRLGEDNRQQLQVYLRQLLPLIES